MYLLKLYVTGKTYNTMNAIKTLKEILQTKLKRRYKLEIIDILRDPMKAEEENIMVTPTLVKKLPLPVRKIIGELVDKEKVLLSLDIKEDAEIEKKRATKN